MGREKVLAFSKIAFRILGILFTLASVSLIRMDPIVQNMVERDSFWGKLLFSPTQSPLLEGQPGTFAFGIIFLLMGAVLLNLSLFLGRNEGHLGMCADEFSPEIQDPRPSEFLIPLAVAFLTLGIFWLTEMWGIHSNWMVLFWCFSLFSVSVFLFIRDNARRVSFSVQINGSESIGLIFLFTIGLLVCAAGLNSWKYSFIGDEYAFLWPAEKMAREGIHNFDWFEASGVYGDVPNGLTVFQGFMISIFQSDNFGWRFSSSFNSMVCLFPIYFIIRHLLSGKYPHPRIAAGIGTLCFVFSEQTLDWARIGKPCNATMVPVVYCLVFYLMGRARDSSLLYFLAAVTCGAGLLFYILGTLISGVLLGGFLIGGLVSFYVDHRRFHFSSVIPIILVVSGFMIAAAPNIVQVDALQHLFEKNLMSKEDVGTFESKVRKTMQTSGMFLHFRARDHFLWGNVFDPITAFLAALSFGAFWRIGLRRSLALLWILIAVAICTGGLSQYGYPPLTRTLSMTIPVSILAGVGTTFLMVGTKRISFFLVLPIVFMVPIYNHVKLEHFNPYKRNLEYIGTFLKPVQEGSSESSHIFIFPKGHNPYLAESIAESYGYENRVYLLEEGPSLLSSLNQVILDHESKPQIHIMVTCQDKTVIKRFTENNELELPTGFTRFSKPERNPDADRCLPVWLENPFLLLINHLEK